MSPQNLAVMFFVGSAVILGQPSSPPHSPQSAPPITNPEPGVPTISESSRQFLSRLARRTIRDSILGRELYVPSYVPAEIQSVQYEVVIRLRRWGYLLGIGVAGPAPLSNTVRDAALSALQVVRAQRELFIEDANQMLIEIEVIGEALPLQIPGDWTQPGASDAYIEPGAHGVYFRGTRGVNRIFPTDFVTQDIVVSDAFKLVAQRILAAPDEMTKAELKRFRTAHWYESASGAAAVSLQRGLTYVPPESVNAKDLDQAIERLAEYMAYRQQASGLFSYQYEPSTDSYTEDDNTVRQAGAVLALSMHARQSAGSASRAAADVSLRHFLNNLTQIPDVENAAFIATPDKRNKLGVSALISSAIAVHPDAPRHAETRRKLINGMLWLQRPSGMFITAFPPAEQIDAQEYFPGEALLAMALDYDTEPDANILDAFDRAILFYRPYFRESRSPAFVPWQVQAYTLMAKHTKRKDFVDFAFELTDWLAEMQLNPSNCPWPELRGGIASYQAGRAGVATASYLEAFTDALALAKRVGDKDRAKRYEEVVRQAARFVLQLQIRPEEAYFIRSPRDAVGGIRTAPALNLLRIDHCQHALVALIKSRQVLFSDPG